MFKKKFLIYVIFIISLGIFSTVESVYAKGIERDIIDIEKLLAEQALNRSLQTQIVVIDSGENTFMLDLNTSGTGLYTVIADNSKKYIKNMAMINLPFDPLSVPQEYVLGVYCGTSLNIANFYNMSFEVNDLNYKCNTGIYIYVQSFTQIGSFYLTFSTTTPDILTGTSSNMILPQNIEQIGYVATTTRISDTQNLTQATYYVPFALLVYVFLLIVLIGAVTFYFLKSK